MVSCGGEQTSTEEAGQQARQDRGGTFAQLAARSQLEAQGEAPGGEAAPAAQEAEAPGRLLPLDLPAKGGAEPLTELPEGFPASIGEYPGMTIEAVSVDQDMVELAFTVAEQPQAVLDTLGKRLQDEGWTLSEVVKDEGGDILSGEKGDEIATFVVIATEGEATRVAGSVAKR